MAKTVAEKLLLKPGTTLWLSDQVQLDLIGPIPADVAVVGSMAEADVSLVFGDSSAEIREVLASNSHHLAKPSVFWVAYQKAGKSDVNRDKLWPILGEFGMRPNSQVAIDETWSALRFRMLKPGEEPFHVGG